MCTVARFAGSAAELHALDLPNEPEAQIWVLEPVRPAVVMGSAQRAEAFDADGLAKAGIDLAPRRSGGGAVFINPSGVAWIDVIAPRGSRWWTDDLGTTFQQVGECWLRALASCGIDADITTTAPRQSDDARLACWAGLGWGEVTVEGVKIVGLSQRRARWGARIQSMAVVDGSSSQVVDWFHGLDAATSDRLRQLIGAVRLDIDRDGLERSVIAELGNPEVE